MILVRRGESNGHPTLLDFPLRIVAPLTSVLLLTVAALYLSPLVPFRDAFPIVLGCAVLFALVAYAAFHDERIWVYAGVAVHGLLFIGSRYHSIAPAEIAHAVVILGGTAVWLLKTFVRRERLVETGFDVLLLTFIVLASTVTAISAILHDGDVLGYVKEWSVLLELLFYFPLRRVINSRRDVVIVVCLFFLIASMNSIYAVVTYRQRLAEAVFQWQLRSRSNINESISIGLLTTAVTVFSYARRVRVFLISLGFAVMGLGVLVISYSRGPIVAGVIGTIIISAMLPWRNGRRVFLALLTGVIVGAATLFIVYPQFASFITSSIGARIATLGSVRNDLSLKARIVESETLVTKIIPQSPLIGYGYGVPFEFISPISHVTARTYFAHNGLLWATYKYGIPLTLLLIGLVIYPVFRLLYRSPHRHDGLTRGIVAAALGYTVAVLIMNNTSTIFTEIAGMLNFALCWAMLDAVHGGRLSESRKAFERSVSLK